MSQDFKNFIAGEWVEPMTVPTSRTETRLAPMM